MFGRFRNSDAGRGEDLSCAEAVVANPQTGGGRGEIAAIIANAVHAESVGKTSRAAGEFAEIGGTVQLNFSGAGHLLHAHEGLECTKKNCSGKSLALAGNVQAVVNTIDEINISEARGPEHDGVARSQTGSGMGGGIALSEVSFNFDDASGKVGVREVADQDLAQEFAAHTARRAGEEGAVERAKRCGRGHK